MQDVFLSSADSLLSTFATYIPSLLGAIVIFLVGLLVASALRTGTKKIFQWTGLTKMMDKAKFYESLEKAGVKKSVTEMFSVVVYWIVLLVFIAAAFETLGLSKVVEVLNTLIKYLPNVLLAAITIILSILLARFARGLISTALESLHIAFGKIAATVAEVFVILFGATIAASQLGLDTTIITANVTLILAGVVAILVLSIGLGSRTATGNLINGYYAKQLFQIGSTVNLCGYVGKVKEVTGVAVILEAESGIVIIPNEMALRKGSVMCKR